MAGNERLAHDETAVAAFVVIVEIRPADAGGPEPQQHFTRSGLGNVDRFDPQVFLGVNAAGKDLLLFSIQANRPAPPAIRP